MRLVVLLTGGRSGSDLLQSLFDGHKEILQFPGTIIFNDKLLRIFNYKSPEKISSNFIKINKKFFDSRLNKFERHDKLGKKKNRFYRINEFIFKKNFLKYFNRSKKTKLDILIALHKAYGSEIEKKKVIILHIHLFYLLKKFLKYFQLKKDIKILLTFRDPLVSMCSTINHWLKFNKGYDLTPRTLFTNYDLHFNNFNNLHFLRKKIRVIKLENLHTKSKKTVKKICKFIKIKYSKVLLFSSYHGLQWWGDSVSKKNLKGLNKNFKNSFDESLFTINEISYFEGKLMHILKKYNYPVRSKRIYTSKYYIRPFNFEKKIWMKSIKLNKIQTILSIPIFYFKRTLLLKKNNFFNQKNLPNEI